MYSEQHHQTQAVHTEIRFSYSLQLFFFRPTKDIINIVPHKRSAAAEHSELLLDRRSRLWWRRLSSTVRQSAAPQSWTVDRDSSSGQRAALTGSYNKWRASCATILRSSAALQHGGAGRDRRSVSYCHKVDAEVYNYNTAGPREWALWQKAVCMALIFLWCLYIPHLFSQNLD